MGHGGGPIRDNLQVRHAQGIFHGGADFGGLVVTDHLLDYLVAAVFIEDDEVPHQSQEALAVIGVFQGVLQFDMAQSAKASVAMAYQGLNYSLPTMGIPMRAARPSETIIASVREKRELGPCKF